ncbi:MAG: hypothetical protein FWE83_00535 [Oscillospiraceae bacterium]|nr:hypothetical protein [Oscillospiraceae bacterium]
MAEEMLQTISKDEIERARFRSRRIFQMDQQHDRIVAQREGKAEGLAEGKAEGLAEGKIEIALKLKRAKALSNEEISQFTGLSLSEVEEL